MRGPSPAAASGGHSSSRCVGLLLSRPLPLRGTGSRCAGSAVVAQGTSRSVTCGILPDQDSNPRPLHWQADSQPLHHQGSPILIILNALVGDMIRVLHIIYPFQHFNLLESLEFFFCSMPGKFWHFNLIDYKPLLSFILTDLQDN